MAEPTGTVETVEDYGKDGAANVKRWLAEIKAYDGAFGPWRKRVAKIIERYRDERDAEMLGKGTKFNILWSNIQTLKPATYAKSPNPDVSRRNKDRDPVALAAAEILERALANSLDAYDFDYPVKLARDDYLLAGRGQMWVRYVPHFGEETKEKVFLQESVTEDGTAFYANDDGEPVEPVGYDEAGAYIDGEPYKPVTYEEAVCDFISYTDFGHTPAPTWNKVRAVWKTERLTRNQLIERFGEEKGKACQLTEKVDGISEDTAKVFGDVFKRAVVHEIWDSESKTAIWISPGYKDDVLDEEDDPLKLDGFFPCPRPLYATMTGDKLIPVPDYVEYQDQAYQIDEMTQRSTLLVKALKLAGVYNSQIGNEVQGLVEGSESTLIPVDNWAMFAEQGGIKGNIDFLPIAEVATVLKSLLEAREQAKRDLYEITGMSDIIRGQSDPRETMGAQRIKGNFASLRIQDKQNEVKRFVRDVLRLKAEIIAEHFSSETLAEISGWSNTPNARTLGDQSQEVFDAAVQLLKDEKLRGYRIDIETDSTVFEDMQEEKQARTEFLTAMSGFLGQAVPAAQQYPQLGKPLAESLMFGIRGFRAGRQLETVWEQAIEEMGQSQPEKPDAEAAKGQIEMQKLQFEMQRLQVETAAAQRKAQADQEQDQMDAQIKAQEHQYRMVEMEAKHDAAMRELALKGQIQADENAAQITRQVVDEANDEVVP